MSDSYGGGDGTVVVGLDDSSDTAALDLAADEAALRGVPLRIVHAHRLPAREPSPDSRAVLDTAWERVGRHFPGLEVEHTLVGGGAGGVLVDESGRAALLVLGGLGGLKFGEWLPTSVLAHVVARAHCPVIVTGASVAPPAAHDPVRVAVDGTVASLNALRFGCEWALRHGVPVEATHVVAPRDLDEPSASGPAARVQLDGWIRTVQSEYPAVSIQAVLVEHAEPPESLVTASHAAAVLAVGAARPHAVPRLAAGSVVPDLIHRAACPVAVVRAWRPD